MGDEVSAASYSQDDFDRYNRHLRDETRLLHDWFENGVFSQKHGICGCELEAWLVDGHARPQAMNERFLDTLDDDMAVPELSAYNVEFNCPPHPLRDNAIGIMADDLAAIWNRARITATDMDLELVMIGILPTIEDRMLNLQTMSRRNRFYAMNREITRLRGPEPVHLDIEGKEHLVTDHDDVMLESAATSFQLHLQVAPDKAARYYNASKITAAPLVALAANSPFLFGRDLWAETRIPLFEQALSMHEWDYSERVTFGIRYLEDSLFGAFYANQQRYAVVLPQDFGDAPPEQMNHVRLHNGTIWRWVRPLIGYDEDGAPHLRIEQRVIPAGPTITDMAANAAFYYGLCNTLATFENRPEFDLTFPQARDNFYACAKHGLAAELHWLDGKPHNARDLILARLIDDAHAGLIDMKVSDEQAAKWLAIIRDRVESGQTGATWQRAYVQQHNAGMNELTEAYTNRQGDSLPVHEWDLSRI